MKLMGWFLLLCTLVVTSCGNADEEPTNPASSAESPPIAAAASLEPADIAAIAEPAADAPIPSEPAATPETTGPGDAPVIVAQADAAPAQPADSRFQLGTHYQRLTPTQPTSSSPEQVEVAEVFWYGCSHCYNFDPYLEKWLPRKAANVNFVRIPATWNPLVKLHARAFLTAQVLEKEEAMHTAFFREIHVNGNVLDTEAKLVDFFSRFGVSSEDFAGAFNSFAVHTRLQQAETLARRYKVTSVPLVVVNGKYTTSATLTGGYDTLMEVIDELVAMEGSSR